MIEKAKFYQSEEDFNELTSDELKIFEIFLRMEPYRHFEDIDRIFRRIGIIECILRKRKSEQRKQDDENKEK